MTYKTLLVHVDTGKGSAQRLDLACELAQGYEAHLTGLYIAPSPNIPPYIDEAGGMPDEVRQARERIIGELTEKTKRLFDERTKRAGVNAEWRMTEAVPLAMAEVTALHSRYADLTIVGQTDPDSDGWSTPRDLPERLALMTGQPVLVVPYAGRFSGIGKRVMVGWNASREATRAVHDALPFLQQAEAVSVLAVNPEGGISGHGDVPGADLALTLARHGVKAEAAHIESEEVEIGDMLLSRAADFGADLLVMGAYGHSRLREYVLGGATRHILAHMTMPILMSH